jgi:hypothetical protein
MKERLPKEIIEIKEAEAIWKNTRLWEKNIGAAGWIVYALSIGLWMFRDFETASPAFLFAFALIIANIVIGRKAHKQARHMMSLISRYQRKAAMPFYERLVDMFEYDKNVQLTIGEDGTINVKVRKEEESK